MPEGNTVGRDSDNNHWMQLGRLQHYRDRPERSDRNDRKKNSINLIFEHGFPLGWRQACSPAFRRYKGNRGAEFQSGGNIDEFRLRSYGEHFISKDPSAMSQCGSSAISQ